MTLTDVGRAALAAAQATRWLLPLVDGAVSEARWSARQVRALIAGPPSWDVLLASRLLPPPGS